MASVSVKFWLQHKRDTVDHDLKARSMGAIQDLEILHVSFNYMDLGTYSIDNISVLSRFHSTMLLWNCRGLMNPDAVDTARDLCGMHRPDVLILTETRVDRDRAPGMAGRLPFDSYLATPTIGRRGGILLLWNSEAVKVSMVAFTEQDIHAVMEVKNSNSFWLFSAIYGSPRLNERKILWDNLETIATAQNLPWLALGDFNEILNDSEKMGGSPVDQNRALRFAEVLNNCGFIDLGFSGPPFTWSNLRQSEDLIQERIDRVVANASWKCMFPNAEVTHLPRVHSDHCPVLLDLNPRTHQALERPFRFQTMWMSHPDFKNLVKAAWDDKSCPLENSIIIFSSRVSRWNKEVFGNIFHKKQHILARLKGIQRSLAYRPSRFLTDLEKQLRTEYSNLLENERELWMLKSRTEWIMEGERNTKFFHVSTLVNRRHNKIRGLLTPEGEWCFDPLILRNMVNKFFKNLYSSSKECYLRIPGQWIELSFQENVELSRALLEPITNKEVWTALKCLKPHKAPGPDGLHPVFFQKNWDLTGQSMVEFVKGVFRTGKIPDGVNETLISLIPKCQSPETVAQFRPISLCNTSHKVVSKIIVN